MYLYLYLLVYVLRDAWHYHIMRFSKNSDSCAISSTYAGGKRFTTESNSPLRVCLNVL